MTYFVLVVLAVMLAREHITLDAWIRLDTALLKVFSLGKSKSGETISAAAWDMRLDGKTRGFVLVAVIDWIFRLRETEHCRKAWAWQGNLYESSK